MSYHEELCCVSVDIEVLTTIKSYETVGNRTPVNKPYVINTNRNEVLPVKVPDNPYIPFHGRGNSIGINTIQAVKPSYVPAAAVTIMKKLLMK